MYLLDAVELQMASSWVLGFLAWQKLEKSF